jgi:hypothetical protein
MTVDLEAIKARLAARTGGDWYVHSPTESENRILTTPPPTRGIRCVAEDVSDADAALISHTPTDLAALVAEVERLREVIRSEGYAESVADPTFEAKRREFEAFKAEVEARLREGRK